MKKLHSLLPVIPRGPFFVATFASAHKGPAGPGYGPRSLLTQTKKIAAGVVAECAKKEQLERWPVAKSVEPHGHAGFTTKKMEDTQYAERGHQKSPHRPKPGRGDLPACVRRGLFPRNVINKGARRRATPFPGRSSASPGGVAPSKVPGGKGGSVRQA